MALLGQSERLILVSKPLTLLEGVQASLMVGHIWMFYIWDLEVRTLLLLFYIPPSHQLSVLHTFSPHITHLVTGGSGHPWCPGIGGKGGNGGGALRINAWKIINNGTISCNGEDGKEGIILPPATLIYHSPLPLLHTSFMNRCRSLVTLLFRNIMWKWRRGRKWRKHPPASIQV